MCLSQRQFHVHAILTLAAVTGLSFQAATAQEKKFAGAQFMVDAPIRPGKDLVRPTMTSKGLLPALHVKVLLPEGARISPGLEKFLPPGAVKRPGAGPEQFYLTDASRDAIRAALEADEVRRMELDRPRQNYPEIRIPFDPIGRREYNLDARISHYVSEFEATFHKGQGKTIKAAIFDGGIVRHTHVEFATGRVAVVDTGSPQRAHATHVAGTMAAKGVKLAALGMAPALSILSYDWNDDLRKLDMLPSDVQVTNHSYGPSTGWDYRPEFGVWLWWGDTTLSNVEDAAFGKYAMDNHILDDILFRRPHLLTVVASGNDRNDAPMLQPVSHYVHIPDPNTGEQVWILSTEERNADGFDNGGLDTIAGLGLSKNCLCVGAINDLVSGGVPIPGASIRSTVFSSWGPADDGRIKPDVAANGESLLSPTVPPPTVASPDKVYTEMSGTSMASPTAAGISGVLAEYYKKQKGRAPFSAELKAVLIHSAVDGGPPGPDPLYGWGSLNALRAGEIISGQNAEIIEYEKVQQGKTKSHDFKATGDPVRVTVVWTDPPAPPNTGPLDDHVRTLQNNLDLTLRSPDGKTYHPYRLVRQGQDWVARTDDHPNNVDNVEVIDAPGIDGMWRVDVTATELGQGEEQYFAMVVSGLTKGG